MSVKAGFLTQGAVYAMEQAGILMRDAVRAYDDSSYGTAVALAAFGREEVGRARILLDLRKRALNGETITVDTIRESTEGHEQKQRAGALGGTIRANNDSGIGELIRAAHTDPQSEKARAARKVLNLIDRKIFKRYPSERHEQRLRALYVEPNEAGTDWSHPARTDKTAANEFVTDAVGDYALALQWFDEALLRGHDDKLLAELHGLAERPAFPQQVWPGQALE